MPDQSDRRAAVAATKAKYGARGILAWLRTPLDWFGKPVTQTDVVLGTGLIMLLLGVIIGLIAGEVKCWIN